MGKEGIVGIVGKEGTRGYQRTRRAERAKWARRARRAPEGKEGTRGQGGQRGQSGQRGQRGQRGHQRTPDRERTPTAMHEKMSFGNWDALAHQGLQHQGRFRLTASFVCARGDQNGTARTEQDGEKEHDAIFGGQPLADARALLSALTVVTIFGMDCITIPPLG